MLQRSFTFKQRANVLKSRVWGAFLFTFLLVFSALPAESQTFGMVESFDASAANGGDSDNHALNDAGTEISVTGDGTYSYGLYGIIIRHW